MLAGERTYSDSNQGAATVARILGACSVQNLGVYAQERPLQGISHSCALSLSSLRLPRAACKAPLLSEKHMQPASIRQTVITHALSLSMVTYAA